MGITFTAHNCLIDVEKIKELTKISGSKVVNLIIKQERNTDEGGNSIFLRYYYKQPKLKQVKDDIHIIGVDVSTSDDYSSVSVLCRSCKSILHSTVYQPGMTCFSIPYYTKCPKCGVKISKHIYKENI